MIAAVVGEGGSGGAVAIAAANRVLMFEHAVYSVISPEGCASILWRTADKAADAAEAMRVTAGDLQALGRRRPDRRRAAWRCASRARRGDRQSEGRDPRGAGRAGEARPGPVARAAPRQIPGHRLATALRNHPIAIFRSFWRNPELAMELVMRTPLALLAATAVLVVPTLATAQAQPQQPSYLNQRDVQEAAQQHPEVVAEFGGAETGPRAAYVEGVGRRVAAYSGTANAGQVYHFTTLNSAVENAFAVPGGYVYITRQLMGIMNDEAELAFVVGHETGHIAANHHQARKSAPRNSSILGVLGAVLGAVVGNNAFGGLISQGAQQFSKARLLSFSARPGISGRRAGHPLPDGGRLRSRWRAQPCSPS